MVDTIAEGLMHLGSYALIFVGFINIGRAVRIKTDLDNGLRTLDDLEDERRSEDRTSRVFHFLTTPAHYFVKKYYGND